MVVDASTLEDFTGKNVILVTAKPGEDAVERTGKVEAGSPVGLAFKEKGKRDAELVEPSEIEDIQVAPEKPKTIAQKKLKPVTETTVRQHLVDRHGMLRSEANNLSDEAAFRMHDELDHSDLGHKHVDPDADEDENEEPEASEED